MTQDWWFWNLQLIIRTSCVLVTANQDYDVLASCQCVFITNLDQSGQVISLGCYLLAKLQVVIGLDSWPQAGPAGPSRLTDGLGIL